MTLYVISIASTDDDNNMCAHSVIAKTKEEAIKLVHEIHDETYNDYINYSCDGEDNIDDDYQDNDLLFDICLFDNISVRTVVNTIVYEI